MILAIDADYQNNKAMIAAILFNTWSDSQPTRQLVDQMSNVPGYASGQFYKRELPCILKILKQIKDVPQYIVIDGYVHLDQEKKPGLGQYLYEALQGQTVVIGVAKKRFYGTPAEFELYRGGSNRPLFVTAAGIDIETAKQYITEMHGNYRIPTLLKLVDTLCRQIDGSR